MALLAHKCLSHLQFFKVGERVMSKCGYLMLPGAFLDKVIPYIGFTDQAVVKCNVSVVKMFLWVMTIFK